MRVAPRVVALLDGCHADFYADTVPSEFPSPTSHGDRAKSTGAEATVRRLSQKLAQSPLAGP